MDTNATGKDTLTYEETPPIEPIKESEPDIFPPPKPPGNRSSLLATLVVFILLFAVGFWLSGTIRKYVGNIFKNDSQENIVPTPSIKEIVGNVIPTTGEDVFAAWQTYQPLNGRSRTAYAGISFKLPSEVLSPICDGSSCQSQGTYLPGGTRFTVALRGVGQVLPDYRGKIISDLKGIPFMTKDTTVGGTSATEFEGIFTGTTVSGYVFSQMRGFMIPITGTNSLEINHFSPSGLTSDFAKDDALFDQIIQTLVLPVGSPEKGGVTTATETPTQVLPSSSPSATPIIEE